MNRWLYQVCLLLVILVLTVSAALMIGAAAKDNRRELRPQDQFCRSVRV